MGQEDMNRWNFEGMSHLFTKVPWQARRHHLCFFANRPLRAQRLLPGMKTRSVIQTSKPLDQEVLHGTYLFWGSYVNSSLRAWTKHPRS